MQSAFPGKGESRSKCVALTGACTLATIMASNPALGRAAFIEETIVTASRVERPLATIPNTVTVVDSEALEQQMSINADLSTALGNLIPSFSPSRQKLTNSGESLRGRKPLYMIDGVPQSNPLRDGGRDAHTIDPAMIERIEVIHGANAVHGLGAAGGIINLITKRPSDTPVHSVRVSADAQEEDLGESFGYSANYGFSGRFGLIDTVASVGYRSNGVGYDANGEIIGFDTTQGDTMDSESLDTFLKAGYNFGQQRLELTYNSYTIEGNNRWSTVEGDLERGIPTTAEEGGVEGDAPKNDVTTISLAYSHEALFGQVLKAQLFSQDFAGTYGGSRAATFQDPAYGEEIFDQSENQSQKYGLKVTLSKDQVAKLPVNLVYGIDVFQDTTQQVLIQTGRNWVPETTYENYAPFFQAEYAGIEKLVISGGVRHEESELQVDDFTTLASYDGGQQVEGGEPSFSETLYNLGATYQVLDALRVYANHAQSFSMPDVGRVLRGIDTPNQSVESFLDLQPISTDNSEVGLELSLDQVRGQVTYFMSESDFGQRLQANADGIYSVEREKTEIDGVEIRADWLLSSDDTLGARYAWTEGRYDSDEDGQVDSDLSGRNIAPNRLNFSWDRSWTPVFNTRLQINQLFDRNFEDAAGDVYAEFDGYTTADINANWQTEVGTFAFSVQNLTNRDYFTYYSQAGAGSDIRNFKGLGRSFRLSYAMQF